MVTKSKRFPYLYLIILLVLALYAARPLFGSRFIPTHDGEYHLIRIHEFYTMLSYGHFFPRWAPGLNSGYGVPIFNFHYPFPNYIGSLFHSWGLSLDQSFRYSLGAGYLTAVVFSFLWLRKLFSDFQALIGAMLAAFVPYWFVDIYVRGSVGEVWAIAWVFVILYALELSNKTLLALSTGFLIVSHNILAMTFIPFILVYMLLRRKKLLLPLALGVGLSAYFWIPALVERKYVTGLNIIQFSHHFPEIFQLLIPSWGTGFSKEGVAFDEMSFQIGVVTIFSVLIGLWLSRGESDRVMRNLIRLFALLFLAAIFFMLPVSMLFWQTIPVLQFIQYPWRLLSLVIPISAVFGAYITLRLGKMTYMSVLLTLFAILVSGGYITPVTYESRPDEYYLTRKEFTDGTSSIGNTFSTVWTGWKSMRPSRKLEVVNGTTDISVTDTDPIDYNAEIYVPESSIIRVHTLYYPGWNVYVDGIRIKPVIWDGLFQFPLIAGNHTVHITLQETLTRMLADGVSVLSLLTVMALAILKRYGYNRF